MIVSNSSQSEQIPLAMLPSTLFRLAGERSLRFPESLRTRETADFLAHLVKREPGNLRIHSQRILLNLERLECEPLFGALLDMFSVLGQKGLDLRRRMLISAKSVLDKNHFEFLASTLEPGLAAWANIPEAPYAVLRPNGRQSSTQLVTRKRTQKSEPADPISEARDYIDHGQLDLALEILERAARSDPSSQEVAKELLNIFAHTRNTAAKERFIESLGDENNFCPAWREAKQSTHTLDR